ncbi:MAG: PQQ-binding-like beta-propeller repeat protein [Verrucomicrobiales bacterium]|nr:PQQ-binding-like beta-propeller repeat protein [Verrucomicrobiales bacterium]
MPGTVGSAAVDANGRAYVAAGRRLYAFGPGLVIEWAIDLSADDLTGNLLIREDGVVMATTRGGQLFALRPTGEAAWEPSIFGVWAAALGPDNGLILTGSGETALTAVSADGTVEWTHTDFFSSPCGPSLRGDGTAYVSGDWAVAATGEVLWHPRRNWAWADAAIGVDGTFYYGQTAPNDRPIESASFVAVRPDGSIAWSYPSGSVVASAAILPSGRLVFGTLDGRMLCLEADGQRVWEYAVGAAVWSSPAVTADGLIWCGSDDGRFLVLDGAGNRVWEWDLGGPVSGSPAVDADGRVYITAKNVGLTVFQGAAPPAASPWPMFRHDAARRARTDVQPAGPPPIPLGVTAEERFERGAVTVSWQSVPWAESYDIWRGDAPEPEAMTLLREAVTGRTDWNDRSGAPDRPYYYRVQARNQKGVSGFSEPVLAQQQYRRWTISWSGGFRDSPAWVPDGTVRCLNITLGDELSAISPDGEILWRQSVGYPQVGPVVSPDGQSYMLTGLNQLVAVAADGQLRWTTELPLGRNMPSDAWGTLVLTPDQVLVTLDDRGNLFAFDTDGQLLWTSRPLGTLTSLAVAQDGGIFLCGSDWCALLERSGALRWKTGFIGFARPAIGGDGTFYAAGRGQFIAVSPTGQFKWLTQYAGGDSTTSRAPVIAPDGAIYVVSGEGPLHAFDAAGEERWRLEGGFEGNPGVLADGTILLFQNGYLQAFDPAGRPLWEARGIPGDDHATSRTRLSPLVTPTGRIYLAMETNLICLQGIVGPANTTWPLPRADARQSGSIATPAPGPRPVSGLTATEGEWIAQIRLAWSPSEDLATCEIWRATTEQLVAAVKVADVLPGNFTYIDPNPPSVQAAFYWVRARNNAGASDFVGPVRGQAQPGATLRWRALAHADLSTPALGAEGRIFAAAQDGAVLAFHSDGSPDWAFTELAAPVAPPAVSPDGSVLVVNQTELVRLTPTGTVDWRRPLASGRPNPPTLGADGRIYLPHADTLWALNPDGSEEWQHAIPILPGMGPIPSALGPDNQLRYSDGRTLYRLDDRGAETWRFDLLIGEGNLSLGSDGSLYAATSKFLCVAFGRDGTPRYQIKIQGTSNREAVLGSEGRAFVTGPFSRHTALDALGAEIWHYAGEQVSPLTAPTPLLADRDGGMLVVSQNIMVHFDASGDVHWRFSLNGGLPGAPFLTEDGQLVLASRTDLLCFDTDLRPAPSGWAMYRADPQRSGRVSSSYLQILELTPRAGNLWRLRFRSPAGGSVVIERCSQGFDWIAVLTWDAEAGLNEIDLPIDPTARHTFYRLRTD